MARRRFSALLAVVPLLAACGSSHLSSSQPSGSVTPRPSVSQTPSPSQVAARHDVLTAYNGMWANMVAAAKTSDYASRLLAEHTVDPATGQLRRTLFGYSRLGVVVKGQLHTHPRVAYLDLSGGQARITDCLDERHWLTYYAKSGRLTDHRSGVQSATGATARRRHGVWRISSISLHPGRSC